MKGGSSTLGCTLLEVPFRDRVCKVHECLEVGAEPWRSGQVGGGKMM